MKQLIVVGALVMMLSGTAEAGIGKSLGTAWTYLFEPVNAVTQLVSDLSTCAITSSVKFIKTVIANANPDRLLP